VLQHHKAEDGIATPLVYVKTEDGYQTRARRTYRHRELDAQLVPVIAQQQAADRLLKQLEKKTSISYSVPTSIW
jgi:hypothetical protein